ncbi:hypothetical protein BCR44DRAFT_1500552 [Catenaria anguillulae PL171]|uniref:Uncharacterized protein n=1 Tax=Catenaria anguillulae PL171 TaxID=765915 RepID=A0A1Y2HIF5_9FUNG|nr:hypothetical protein BCR44DRAFT_1500552 [Catenaria anguillulae PL171]
METTPLPRYLQLGHLNGPCALLTVFFHQSAARHEEPLDCVRALTPPQLGILAITVFSGTSCRNPSMEQFLSLASQQSAVESLVAHVLQGLETHLLSTPSTSIFDLVTLCLRAGHLH